MSELVTVYRGQTVRTVLELDPPTGRKWRTSLGLVPTMHLSRRTSLSECPHGWHRFKLSLSSEQSRREIFRAVIN